MDNDDVRAGDVAQRLDVTALESGPQSFKPSELPGSETYLGHEGVKEAVEDWPKQWDGFRFELLEIIDVSDRQIVSVTRHYGRGAVSGVEVNAVIAYLHTITDGKFARLDMFVSEEQALTAAGLSE